MVAANKGLAPSKRALVISEKGSVEFTNDQMALELLGGGVSEELAGSWLPRS